MAEIVIVIVMLCLFALGFILGEQIGWDRCWKDITKYDSWQKYSREKKKGSP